MGFKPVGSVVMLILCLLRYCAHATYQKWNFNRSQFNDGELTLEDIYVNESADKVAENMSGPHGWLHENSCSRPKQQNAHFLSKAVVQTLFAANAFSSIPGGFVGKCSEDLKMGNQAWLSLNKCGQNSTCARKYQWIRIGSVCSHQVVPVGRYSFSVLDSQGRRPDNLLHGNRYWIGSYQQCMALKQTTGDTKISVYRYCQAAIRRKSASPILFGICAPESCSNQSLYDAISQGAAFGDFSVTCQEEAGITRDTSAIIALVFFSCYGILLLLATCFDYVLLRRYLNGRRNGDTDVASTLVYRLHTSDIQNSIFCSILLSFSLLSNYAKLVTTITAPGQIDCFHGIRVTSLFCVILNHSIIVINAVDNPIYTWRLRSVNKCIFSILQVQVDTFFLLSGISLSYNWFQEINRKDIRNKILRVSYWLRFYCYRYIRLTPVYALILWYYSEISWYIQSGPLWPMKSHYCRGTWWQNLLYINNYTKAPCMLWTWYLAVDFQLHLLSPAVLVTLVYYPKMAYALSSLLIVVCMSTRGIVYAINKFPPNTLIGFEEYGAIDGWMRAFERVYMATHYRFTPYIIGILFGRLLLDLKQRRTPIVHEKALRIICWTLCSIFVILYVSLPFIIVPLPPVINGIYSGWINSFLSNSYWLKQSRASYCAYLIHGLVYEFIRDGAGMPHHYYSVFGTATIVTICYIATTYLSRIAAVAFEMPVLELNKLFVKYPCQGRHVSFSKSVTRVNGMGNGRQHE